MEKRDFSLLDILQILKTRWWILLLAAILLGSLAGAYSWYSYDPTYSTTVEVIANNTSQQDTTIGEEYNQVNMALKEIETYKKLLESHDFMLLISKAYETEQPELWAEKNYTATRLGTKCFEYEITENTYLFTVTITTHSKEASYELGRIFERLAPQRIETMYNGKASIAISEHATVPTSASNSRNMARNTMMGALIGMVLAFIVLVIIELSDVRIKGEEDIIDNYPVPLLGSIPNFESARKRGYGYGKK